MKKALLLGIFAFIPALFGFICEIDTTLDPGETCNPTYDYADGWCSSADSWVYCASDYVVYDRSCTEYCATVENAYSDGCAYDTNVGYDRCICYWDTCSWTSACYDPLTIAICTNSTVNYYSCDDWCYSNGYGSKGSCNYSTDSCDCG